MNNRRSFFRKSAAIGLGAFGVNSLFNELHAADFQQAEKHWNPEGENEDYWSVVQMLIRPVKATF